MEIYTLEITLPFKAKKPWRRVIEVAEDTPLFELHYFIQMMVKFDNDHLYEFHIAKTPGRNTQPIDDEQMLNEVYPLHRSKLFYLFDFGDCWLFQFKKLRKKAEKQPRVKYPRVVESEGRNPRQY
ncbi:hypothetical protein EMM73_17880 [Rheinheimera sediminis]|uniref:IS1096 element passenger TnpR family protein n=1 Tax=Rheinheimera sp. YQF-1 TaxID=2499626 RepID=UPI000FDAC303|nr:hypothetical protein [Rheinheimera sp. YQF-1]RVT42814.1 hypothetical protein EMM73_17880 [Rheinheimera sp. YQF-1]